MQAATELSSAPKETKSSAPNRADETTVRRLLQQTSAAQPASRAKDDPRAADDPNVIVRLLLETARLACSRYDRALRAHLPGMTLGRCSVLIQLAQHERPNQAALARILDIRPITLVRLLDRLEAGGFVERIPDPDDRRAHVLTLTAKALPIIESIHDLNRKTCIDLHLGFSKAEATQLRVLLSRIRSELTAARLNDDPASRPQAPAARCRKLADCDNRRAGDLAKGGKEPEPA
jgi:MarR family transcriptional regulator, transcriptional regulator for hemolysin